MTYCAINKTCNKVEFFEHCPDADSFIDEIERGDTIVLVSFNSNTVKAPILETDNHCSWVYTWDDVGSFSL